MRMIAGASLRRYCVRKTHPTGIISHPTATWCTCSRDTPQFSGPRSARGGRGGSRSLEPRRQHDPGGVFQLLHFVVASLTLRSHRHGRLRWFIRW